MQTNYDAPVLILIGQTEEVVMGSGLPGGDFMTLGAADFEFERD